ncbi:hypothetical protein [Pseudovibrio sp. Ad26]|uniref:hypothetical protein n=1 Tax=Pseudovibrio sp. Ad26 TaxID=989410 RepID=UPI0007AEB7FF|nr:hypothetical protein [Pseudovibrio sp. Ad26]KZL10710.1 hypothetical protein PsAD26_03075 [Pseudovibrio sp. Ad26]
MSKTMWIASLYGLKIPASVLGGEEVKELDPGEAIEVPDGYGTHLIEDGLAYEAEEPETEPVSGGGSDDAYSAMSKDELEEVAEELGYKPPGNIKEGTLRNKVRKLVSEKFAKLEAKAKEIGIEAQDDWTIEEYEAAIQEASK